MQLPLVAYRTDSLKMAGLQIRPFLFIGRFCVENSEKQTKKLKSPKITLDPLIYQATRNIAIYTAMRYLVYVLTLTQGGTNGTNNRPSD